MLERLLSEPQTGPAVRVILVGKTGLDARLRLDPGFEVVRVRSAMEAIGELSVPEAEGGRSVVIVGDEAGSLSSNDAVARDFVAGVRTINPNARVLRAVAPGAAAPRSFDGAAASDASPEQLRALLGTVQAAPAHAGFAAAAPLLAAIAAPVASAPASITAQAPASARPAPRVEEPPVVEVPAGAANYEVGDEELARTLARGLEIAPVALNLLRRRLGDPSITLAAGREKAHQAGEATVAWEGTIFGTLRASAVPSAKLAKAADWLGAWMRLGEQQNALRVAAYTDPLTGAFNRRYFDRFLETAIAQAREERRSVTVLVFDLDDFKQYNDRFGHGTGDEILRETVKLLKSVVRPTDWVCRIGGDEFAAIFHEPEGPRESGSRHPQTIHAIAGRFQKQIREHKFPKLADAPGPLTISGGLASYPWDGATPAELLARADELLLQSKAQGKNVITIGR